MLRPSVLNQVFVLSIPRARPWCDGLLTAVAAMTSVATGAAADTLYGFTTSSLVSFDTTAPGTLTTIGPTGLTPTVTLYSPTYNPFNGRVYAFGSRPNAGSYELSFIEVNLQTGAATTLQVFGQDTAQSYEALAYVHSLGTMVASQSNPGTNNPTPRLGSMSALGNFSQLSSTGLDNDLATYDAARNILYTVDVFGGSSPNRAFTVNPLTGGSSEVWRSFPDEITSVAWSGPDDAIYASMSGTNQLARIASGTTFGLQIVGPFAEPVGSIFAIPAPTTVAVLGVGCLLTARRRR